MLTNMRDYWLGCVLVTKDYITLSTGENQVYEINIIVGKYGKSSWLSGISADTIPKIIAEINNSPNKFLLKIYYGVSYYNYYLFNKRLKKELLRQLEDIIKTETIYYDKFSTEAAL